jgi:hypothetical protein
MSTKEEYADQLLEKIHKLSLDRVAEVLDFASFLEAREASVPQEIPEDISDKEFEGCLTEGWGLWKDEVDGVTYTNKLRAKWRDPYGGGI